MLLRNGEWIKQNCRADGLKTIDPGSVQAVRESPSAEQAPAPDDVIEGNNKRIVHAYTMFYAYSA